MSNVPAPAEISLSPRAAQRIAEIMRAEGKPVMLRVAVSGGGCSGFQYGFVLDDTKNEDDLVVERDGAVVVVDSVSLEFLKGAEIDFVDNLMGRSFQVKNPNAKSSCGCGASFSV
jgi:iron-sulfur cluster assembly accessory protein